MKEAKVDNPKQHRPKKKNVNTKSSNPAVVSSCDEDFDEQSDDAFGIRKMQHTMPRANED